MQVNHMGHKMTTAFVAVMLTTSELNERNKNGKFEVKDKKKACRAIYTKENRAELI